MKKVHLTRVTPKNKASIYTRSKKHNIYVHGNCLTFGDKKQAAKALTIINKTLNFKLDEINLLYSEIILEYRRIWRLIDLTTSTSIREKIMDIDRLLHRTTEINDSINANHYVFQNSFLCIEYCQRITIQLREVYKHKRDFIQMRILDSFLGRCLNLNNDLERLKEL